VLAVWADATRSGADGGGRLGALDAATVVRPPSARAARMAFDGGIGDVVALYEVEARVALDGETVVPPETLLVEPIVCVVPRNVAADKQDLIEALIEFLWSDEAGATLREYGYRLPGPEGADRSSGSPGTFRLADLGEPRDLGTAVLEGAWREVERRRSRGGR
jgi:ABC-type sulfate transport system substrate-binding protein